MKAESEMTWNEMILDLLKCAETLYHIEMNDILEELSSDGIEIIGKMDISEIAGKLELLAKVMFCDNAKRVDIKRFLKEELK